LNTAAMSALLAGMNLYNRNARITRRQAMTRKASVLAVLLSALFMLAGCDPYKEGMDLLEKGEYKDAALFFKEMTKKYPEDLRSHHELAYAYTRLEMYDSAIEEYQKVLELDPENFQARFNLGTVCLRAGRWDRARDELDKARELRPGHVSVHLNLASAYLGLQEFAKALEHVKKAQQLAGDERDLSGTIQELEYANKRWNRIQEWLESPEFEKLDLDSIEKPGEQKRNSQ